MVCLGLFLLLIILAFNAYPGGNNFNPLATGHSFWLNFWCDVMAEKTLNDVTNSSRPFAVIAAFFLILGMLILGITSKRILPLSKIKYRVMLSLGVLSIITAPGVNYAHDSFLIITATSGFLAYVIFLHATWQASKKYFFSVGVLAFLTGFLNFVLWLQEHQTIFLPIIQKVSTIFFCMWMFTGGMIFLRLNED